MTRSNNGYSKKLPKTASPHKEEPLVLAFLDTLRETDPEHIFTAKDILHVVPKMCHHRLNVVLVGLCVRNQLNSFGPVEHKYNGKPYEIYKFEPFTTEETSEFTLAE